MEKYFKEYIMNRSDIRIGYILLGRGFNPDRFEHVRSGFRVIGFNDRGVQVSRVHYSYFSENGIETFTIPERELINFSLLPEGYQLPLL